MALAKVALELMDGKRVPEKIELATARLSATKHIAQDGPGLWGWAIFPPGFNAPHMLDLARSQAWTIKPALLHAPGVRSTFGIALASGNCTLRCRHEVEPFPVGGVACGSWRGAELLTR